MSCKLCDRSGGNELWANTHLRIVRVDDPQLPGFIRVIWNRHVSEMSELEPADRRYLMDIVFRVEQLVMTAMAPQKINLASLGNQVPHVHWHIIPRYQDDAFFPDSVWSSPHRQTAETVLATRGTKAKHLGSLIQREASDWQDHNHEI